MGLKKLGLAAAMLAAATLAGAAHPAKRDDRLAALDRDMPALLSRHGVPSVSIAHVEKGRIVLAAAYGEQGPGVAATPDTIYNVASLTKPVAAETVLRLAAAGKLSLDGDVNAKLVGWKLPPGSTIAQFNH